MHDANSARLEQNLHRISVYEGEIQGLVGAGVSSHAGIVLAKSSAEEQHMRETTRQQHERSVGLIRSIGAVGESGEFHWVRCPKADASVPLERCTTCPSMVSLTRDTHGNTRSLRCAVLEQAVTPEEASRPLSLARLTVADLMTRNVLCVRPHLSLDALSQLFLESQLKAVPVVDDKGRVLGIVSEPDLQLEIHARRPDGATRTAGDLMLPTPFTLAEDAPVTRAAALMVFEGVSQIVVVTARGAVVGVLSASDILYWLAKADGFMLPPPRTRGR